jgi:hypothetical protein
MGGSAFVGDSLLCSSEWALSWDFFGSEWLLRVDVSSSSSMTLKLMKVFFTGGVAGSLSGECGRFSELGKP